MSTGCLGGSSSSWQYALCGAAHCQRRLWAIALLLGSAMWTEDEAKQVVVLGDGALWIWKLVSEQLRGAVQIVDLYHAQQHVWEVAHAVFGHSSQQGSHWAKQACTLLVHGQIEELVTAIAALPKIPPEPNESRSVPEKAVDYFTINAERMRYPSFRATSACM